MLYILNATRSHSPPHCFRFAPVFSTIKVWDLRTLGLITHMDGAAPICIHGKQLFSGCYDVPDMIKVPRSGGMK